MMSPCTEPPQGGTCGHDEDGGGRTRPIAALPELASLVPRPYGPRYWADYDHLVGLTHMGLLEWRYQMETWRRRHVESMLEFLDPGSSP